MTKVNRRGGSICECESWWSIGQKFSFLNCVPFAEFMFLIQREKRIQRTKNYHPSLLDGADAGKAAALLDESMGTFHCSGDDIYIPYFLRRHHPILPYLRHCPKCLEYGFHSPAHQLDWFDKCLVHGCTLVIGCPFCGRIVSYSSDKFPRYRVERYCCPCGKPIWNGLLSSHWQKMDRKTLQPIYSYLDWVGSMGTQRGDSLAAAMEFISGDGRHKQGVNASWIMCCLGSLSDVPTEVRAALSTTIVPCELQITSTYVKPQAIVAAIDQFGILKLLESYRFWCEQTNLIPLMLPLVKSIRKYLLGRHTCCLNRQNSLMEVATHNLHHGTKCYCPHVENALIFEKRWAFIHDNDSDTYDRELALKVADSLRDLGLVRYSKDEGKQYDERWSSCGRLEFFGDYTINIHLSPALAQLMDRLWALEMFKSANMLSSGNKYQWYLGPFGSTFSNPLVLVEAGPDDTLNVRIWSSLPLRSPANSVGARASRRHRTQVARLTADDEAKVLAKGHPLERLWPS